MASVVSVQGLLRVLIALALAASATLARAEPLLTEFMAANSRALADADGDYSDWVEIHNPDSAPLDLAGWYLTDSAQTKTKWQFPAVTLQPGAFLVVFASNKNRTSGPQLHTNFALSAGGEYLALVKPDGVTVAHHYAPAYPAQADDLSYGLIGAAGSPSAPGYLAAPTPGTPNVGSGGPGPIEQEIAFSRPAGPFRTGFSLELSGANAGQVIRYATASGRNAAGITLNANSPIYTGPLLIEQSTVVYAAVFAENGNVSGPVSSAHYGKVDASISGFSSRLPVVVLDSLGSGPLEKDGIDHPSWFYLYPARDNGAASLSGMPEVISPLTASVRGASSAAFPKKGFNVKFRDETGADREQSLLDLPAFEKWALVAPWSFDLTYITNAFIYSLSNQIGRWAPRTRLVEVFHNTNGDAIDAADYAGIYAITDRIEIDRDRLNIASLSPKDTTADAITGGYLLKIDVPDPDEVSWVPQRLVIDDAEAFLVLASPKADDVTPAQLDYIQNYVQRMENALHADRATGWAQRTYLDYIDRASWVDFHLLNVFSANPDAFVRSSYFHKDRGGKIVAGPIWDFDRALGSHWDPRSSRYDVWQGEGVPDYWRTGWWGVIASDPEFIQDWVDRWQSLRRAQMTDHNVATLVDSWSAQIGNEAAARDAARWPDSVSPYGNHTATARLLRDWVVNRARWIDQQFVLAPEISAGSGEIVFTPPSGAQLVYTLDGSDPRSLGGDLAPNALVSTTALRVPANANVHVRSYRPEARGVYPGSPWSSAVGGENSSPLLPKARLINISSRAIVGTGENALIAGVVVADTEAKRYLSRAVGPGLAAFGATGVVADPQLSIFAQHGVELFRNNAWETGADSSRLPTYARRVGAFPLTAGSQDSALANELSGGAYTIQVTSPTARSGVGLAELYELDANGRTVNLSTRAYVHTGEGVLIGGFVVSGPAYKRMLVRAIGPTLGAFGVSDALVDPILTIYSGSTVAATNDQWESGENVPAVSLATQRVGAFALASGSQDAAMLVTLPPGAYTVEVKGKAGGEGVALLEIYEVP